MIPVLPRNVHILIDCNAIPCYAILMLLWNVHILIQISSYRVTAAVAWWLDLGKTKRWARPGGGKGILLHQQYLDSHIGTMFSSWNNVHSSILNVWLHENASVRGGRLTSLDASFARCFVFWRTSSKTSTSMFFQKHRQNIASLRKKHNVLHDVLSFRDSIQSYDKSLVT